MRVEVDIFSGRPSPFWTASPQEAEALTDRLRPEHLRAGRLGNYWDNAPMESFFATALTE
jgi:hypothetical protein